MLGCTVTVYKSNSKSKKGSGWYILTAKYLLLLILEETPLRGQIHLSLYKNSLPLLGKYKKLIPSIYLYSMHLWLRIFSISTKLLNQNSVMESPS